MRPTNPHTIFWFLAISIGFCPAPLLAQGRPRTVPTQQPRFNENTRAAVAVTDLGRDLRNAKTLLRRVTDRKLRLEIEALLVRAESNLVLIKADMLLGESVWKSLTEAEFQQLLKQVKRQSLSKKKAEYLSNYAKLAMSTRTDERLTSGQVRRLLAEIEFDSDRVATAAVLFEITSDKQNYLTALESIKFDRNRKTVQRRLGFLR